LNDPAVHQQKPQGLKGSWNLLVLAPLVKLAQLAGTPPLDSTIINLARSRRLLDSIESATKPEEIVSSFMDNPALLESALTNLEDYLTTLTLEIRADLASRILDAACTLAEQSPAQEGLTPIEPAEYEYLRLLRRALYPETAPKVLSQESKGVISTIDPAAWAAGWTEPMVDAAFSLLAGLHEHHENEWKAGNGLLDQFIRLSDRPSSLDIPICDQGLLVFPQSWSVRKIWIIGDLHGDIKALKTALSMAGVDQPGFSDTAAILFLGDYGDRGTGTLAVWLSIAALKQRFPQRVFLLRGNHEETVAMKLTREDTGNSLNTIWHVPSTNGMESYLMLAMAMHGNPNDVSTLYNQIPDVAILPDGVVALHGCLPPRWKEGDGWGGTEEEKEALAIRSLADLRKPAVRGTIRWTDFTDREVIVDGWRDHARGSRLFADREDLAHWRSLFGDFRMVHGHTHPSEGFRWEAQGQVLALNTSIHTSPKLAIACLQNGNLEPIPIT
jgi:hypothetical protein